MEAWRWYCIIECFRIRHTVNHRESYWELFTRNDRLTDPSYSYPPVRLLGIGECQYFTK